MKDIRLSLIEAGRGLIGKDEKALEMWNFFGQRSPLNTLNCTVEAMNYIAMGSVEMAIETISKINNGYLINALTIICSSGDSFKFYQMWNAAFPWIKGPGIIINPGLIVSLPSGK